MNDIDLSALEELTGTRLRAAAAALALGLLGEQVTVTSVAAAAGVSRQALHKSHPAIVELINELRDRPPVITNRRPLPDSSDAEARLRTERDRRRKAEIDRDRALHHLEVVTAELAELRNRSSNLSPLTPRRGRTR